MKIKKLFESGKPVKSFEIFPPKKDAEFTVLTSAIEEIAALGPDFVSVTYSAGGSGGREKTAEIARIIQEKHSVPALAHLTCVGASKAQILNTLEELSKKGIENILALRGDLPESEPANIVRSDFRYASDLVCKIKEHGDFCVGGACYPEGHIECDSLEKDLENLKMKQDCGADFLVSQLFFENSKFLYMLEKARAAGISVPISAGIMPFFSRSQVERMIFMCGASLPSDIIKILHKYENCPSDLQKAGVEYAIFQIRELLSAGIDGVHIYTMNKPLAAKTIIESI